MQKQSYSIMLYLVLSILSAIMLIYNITQLFKVCYGKNQFSICNLNVQEDTPLAFVFINDHSTFYLHISPQDYSYTELGGCGTIENGCVMEYQALANHGIFNAKITPGEYPEPNRQDAKFMLCADCQDILMQISESYDVVLIDFIEHKIYDICSKDYRFDIRNYSIRTVRQSDGSINVDIYNNDAEEKFKPDWV